MSQNEMKAPGNPVCRVYFAHPVSMCRTPVQDGVIDLVTQCFRLCGQAIEMINPNDPKHRNRAMELQDAGRNPLDYFMDLVRDCDALVAVPFDTGALGCGIMAEMKAAMEQGIPVFVPNVHTEQPGLMPMRPALFETIWFYDREQTRSANIRLTQMAMGEDHPFISFGNLKAHIRDYARGTRRVPMAERRAVAQPLSGQILMRGAAFKTA